MSKILLGISFLLSVVLLGGCGAGGDGSSGAAGAAGAAGTIAVPSAGSLALAATDADNDTDYDLGQVAKTFTLSGTDNLSADNRNRYYGYLGTSSTTKDFIVQGTTGVNSVGITGNIWSGVAPAWPIDTRLQPSGVDNYTLTLNTDARLGTNQDVTHIIVCPGNEAGDAAACASAAIMDVGFDNTKAGGTSGDTAADNSTLGGVVPTGSASAFEIFHTNSTATGAIAAGLTHSKGQTVAVTSGSSSAVHGHATDTSITGALATLGTSNAVFMLVQDNKTNDNGTIYHRSGATGNLTQATPTINDTKLIRKGALLVPVSDTYAYAVWARSSGSYHWSAASGSNDNDTQIRASFINLSTPSATNISDYINAKAKADGEHASLTCITSGCVDNNTQQANASSLTGAPDGLPSDFPLCAAGRAETSTAGSYAGGATVAELAVGYADNGTRVAVDANWKISFTRDSDNFSYRTSTDTGINTDAGYTTTDKVTQVCGMAWAGGLINSTPATDNGTLWFAGNQSTETYRADNVSLLYTTLADNGSTATMTQAGSIDYGDEVNQIAVTYDYLNRPYVGTLLDNGSVYIAWVPDITASTEPALVKYGNGGATNAADSTKPISFVRSADGKTLALSYHTAGSDVDLDVLMIYTEN